MSQKEHPFIPPDGSRYVGFCKRCHDFVELDESFSCECPEHTKDDLSVAMLIGADEARPHMPKYNLGALVMPPLWGPAHGQWYMILFYPLWLVMDNLIYGAVHGNGAWIFAIIAGLILAVFTIFYARNANTVGYVRVADEKSLDEYLRSERIWSWVLVLLAVGMIVFATWYNLAVRPGLA